MAHHEPGITLVEVNVRVPLVVLHSNGLKRSAADLLRGRPAVGEGVDLEPGRYRAFARLRVDAPARPRSFSLCAVDQAMDQIFTTMTHRATNTDYQEMEIGAFEYGGPYTLRLSDYSSPGIWVDYVYVVPQPGTGPQ